MDYLPGERLIDCWDHFTPEKKRRTAEDFASITATLYNITSTLCGSLLADHSLQPSMCAQRFGDPPPLPPTAESDTTSGRFAIGPVNATFFVEPLFPAPFERCGPFRSERQYLEAVAYVNINDDNISIAKHRRWPREKLFEIYDVVRPLYSRDTERVLGSAAARELSFHFSHGDLSDTNILVDKDSGHITGVIDWELSGFRPSWLAAGSGGWLAYEISERAFYEDSWGTTESGSTDDDDLRNYFWAQLFKCNAELAHHHRHGMELRAIHQTLGEVLPRAVITWIAKYHDDHWNVDERGQFPFDLRSWLIESDKLWRR